MTCFKNGPAPGRRVGWLWPISPKAYHCSLPSLPRRCPQGPEDLELNVNATEVVYVRRMMSPRVVRSPSPPMKAQMRISGLSFLGPFSGGAASREQLGRPCGARWGGPGRPESSPESDALHALNALDALRFAFSSCFLFSRPEPSAAWTARAPEIRDGSPFCFGLAQAPSAPHTDDLEAWHV